MDASGPPTSLTPADPAGAGMPLPDWAALDDAARLQILDLLAADFVAAHRPANTVRAYGGDWKIWREFAALLGIPERTGTVGALVTYVRWLDTHKRAAVATMDRRVTGAIVTLRELGVDVDKRAGKLARETIKDVARRLSQTGERRGRGQAPPLPVVQLRRISAALPDTLAGKRDRALLLVGFPIAARRAHIAALRVGHIADDPAGLVVSVPWVKTSEHQVAVPRGTQPETCPERAWHAWRDAAGIADDVDGPAFRPIDRHGNLDRSRGLSPAAIGDIIARVSARAGVPGITGHSIRAGLATEARRAGHDAKTIAAQGGWSPTSRSLYEYMRVVDRWSDNAAAGLGL